MNRKNFIKPYYWLSFLMIFMSVYRIQAQTTSVTYTLQTGNVTNKTSSSGTSCFAGTYNSTSSILGLYANGSSCTGTPQSVDFESFNTTGASAGTARPMQPGDSFTIQLYIGSNTSFFSGGTAGISFDDNTTYSAVSNYNTNQRGYVQLNGGSGNNWFSNSCTTYPSPGSYQTFGIKTTSSNTYNMTIGGVTYKDITMLNSPGTSAHIQSFALWNFGSGSSNDFLVQGASLVSTGLVYIGGSNGTYTSGLISDDLYASSASATLANTVVKVGTGTITFTNVNTYTGSTVVNAGTLLMGASNVISSSSNVILNGGIFSTGSSTGYSQTLGTLQLTANSTINLGTSNSHSVTFGDSHGISWTSGKTLSITNWNGTAYSSGTKGQILLPNSTALTSTQLAQITFNGFTAGASIIYNGSSYELVPAGTTITSFSYIGAGTGYTGDSIAVTGTNFTGTSAVTIGGVTAGYKVCSNTTIDVAIPTSGASGNVVVTNLGAATSGSSVTYLGYITTAATDWNTGSTWRGGSVPAAGYATTIANAITINSAVSNAPSSITVNSSSSITFGASGSITSTSVTINSSGSIVMTSGGTLTIATGGTFTNSGTFTYGTGTVSFAGTGTISGTIGFYTVTIAGGVTFSSGSTVYNSLQINAGGFVNTTAPTYASNSTLIYNVGASYGRSSEWSATSGAGYPYNVTIQNSGTILDLGAHGGAATARQMAGTLTISNGTTLSMNVTAMSAALTVNGSINVNSGGALVLGGSSGGDINVGGNWTCNGTFTNNGRAVTFTGSTQAINTANSFAYITINSGSTVSLALSTSPTIANSLTINLGGTFAPGANTVNFSSGVTLTNNGIFTMGTSTMNFAGTGTISGTIGFYNVTIAGGVNFGTASTINGSLQINGGGFANTNPPTYATGSYLVYNSGTNYGASGEWVTGATSGAGIPYNVTIQNNGSVNFGAATTYHQMNGSLNVNSGCTLILSTASGGDLKIVGNWTCNGSLTHNSRAVFFVGSGSAQTINTANTFGYLLVNNTSGVTLAANTAVAGNLTLSNGSITLSNYNLTLTGGTGVSGIVSATASIYVQTNGTGSLRHAINNGTTYTFPVGNSEHDSLSLTNSGTTDTFGVRVADGQLPGLNDAAKTVTHGWIVSKTSGAGNIGVAIQWNHPTDEGSNFSSGTYNYIGLLHSGTRIEQAATAGGSIAAPHYTTVSNFTTLSSGDTLAVGRDDGFLVASITSFTPSSGYTGTSVTISGNNLSTVSSVTIGGVSAAITAQSNTSLTVTVGAGSSGVITCIGTSGSVSSGSSFIYLGYITTAAGDWNTAGTWLGGSVPSASSLCTVANAITVNASVSNSLSSITVTSTGSLTFGASGSITSTTITVNSSSLIDMTNGGTLTMATGSTFTNNGTFNGGAGTVSFSGTGTISGTCTFNNVTISGGVNFGSASTINGNLKINGGGYVNTNPPTYATGSYLIYNSTRIYAANAEWTTNAASGAGVPYNVTIQNTDSLSFGTTTAYHQMNGSLNVINTGTLILSTGSGGDLKIGGNWTCNGTFINNGRGITFLGTSQTIYTPNTFAYVSINSGSNLSIASSSSLTISNSLTINSGGTFAPGSNTISFSSGATLTNNGTFTGGSSTVLFVATGTVNGSDTTKFNNVIAQGGMDFGVRSLIQGYLKLNLGSYVNGNTPIYGTGSTLIYNSGGSYGRRSEWDVSANRGYPYNIRITNNTTLDLSTNQTTLAECLGNFTVTSGSTVTLNNMAAALKIGGTDSIIGTLTLGNTSGDDLYVGGNWYRTGTFNPNNRAVFCNGTGMQTIQGGESFPYLFINNTSGVKINGKVTITTRINLNYGVLTADTVIITNSSTGSVTGHQTDPTQAGFTGSSYIHGILKRAITGTGQYDFPVGTSSNYELISVSNSSLTGTNTLTAMYDSTNTGCSIPNPDSLNVNGTKITSMLGNGYWIIIPDNEPTGGTYTAMCNIYGFSAGPGAASQLTVIKRPSCSSSWTTPGTHSNSTQTLTNGVAHAERSGLTAFSNFGIGWGDEALPLTLISFTGTSITSGNLLQWVFQDDKDVTVYTIEKSSDGQSFTAIGNVEPEHGGGLVHNYSYLDNHVSGTSYYRLKMTTTTGINYSFIIVVVNSENMITPLAVSYNNGQIIIANPSNTLYKVNYYDMNGNRLLSQTNNSTQLVDVSSWSKGMYLVQMMDVSGTEHVFKIIKY